MSVTAIGMALDVRGVTSRAKIVLIAICNCANEYTFLAYPSRRDLAETAECSVDTVDRCLRELADIGIIEKQERERDDGRGQTSNEYRVFPLFTPRRKNAAPSDPSREDAARGNASVRLPQPQIDAAPPAAYGAAPKEPLLEPLGVVSSLPARVVSKTDIAELIERAGDGCDPTAASVHHAGDLSRFLRGGCDWVEDILPAVDKLAASFRRRGKRFGTWALLEEHVVELRDRRLAGLPEPTTPARRAPNTSGRGSYADVIDRMTAEGRLP